MTEIIINEEILTKLEGGNIKSFNEWAFAQKGGNVNGDTMQTLFDADDGWQWTICQKTIELIKAVLRDGEFGCGSIEDIIATYRLYYQIADYHFKKGYDY